MATFTERIRLIFDVDSKGAQAGFGGFAKSVREAEGASGKFRAGLTSIKQGIGDFLKSGAGMATVATAGAAALWKAADAASDLALRVGKMRDATKLAAEDASRWVEVAGDMGISAEKVADLIGKMTRNIGQSPEKMAALGIELQRTSSGAADVNATLLLAVDRINSIEDPTKRAAAAQAVFGRSWADAAELISMGSAGLKTALDSVAEAKIVDDGDIADARDMRDAMDDLKDVGEDLALSLGKQAIPIISGLAKALKVTVDAAQLAGDALLSVSPSANSTYASANDARKAWEKLGEQFMKLPQEARGGINSLQDFVDATSEFAFTQGEAGKSVKFLTEALAENADYLIPPPSSLTSGLAKLADHLDDVRESTERTTNEWRKMQGELDDQDQFANVQLELLGLQRELDGIAERAANGDITGEEAWIMAGQAVNGAKQEVADYAEEILKLPPEQATEVLALIDMGKYEEAMRLLAGLTEARNAVVYPVVAPLRVGGDRAQELKLRGFARGTKSAPSGLAVVGENGPELVNFRGGESVLPAGQTAGALGGRGDTISITVNTLKADADIGRVIVDALNAHKRNGGKAPL